MKPKARVKRLIFGSALFGAGAMGLGMTPAFWSWLTLAFAVLATVGALIVLWPSPDPPKPPETEPEPYHETLSERNGET